MVAVQSHMDMVCESNDPNFDFENSPIETYIDGEWLKAKGTTLGADDGIGVAMEMALLKADDIEHGPLVYTRRGNGTDWRSRHEAGIHERKAAHQS